MKVVLPAVLAVFAAAACGDSGSAKPVPDAGEEYSPYTKILPEPQRTGDPDKGYHALVNEGYVSCGIPYPIYKMYIGGARPEDKIDGRDGHNVNLPYYQTSFTKSDGMELVSQNCLFCHAGHINGQLVLGLGNAEQDFTGDQSGIAGIATMLTNDPAQKAELQKLADRITALAPFVQLKTVGVNPADNIAAVLFAHRDAPTLAWSPSPILPEPPQIVVPVNVPPWWRMKKKNAMFYNAAGKGDHARIMMTASTLCTDTVDEARHIDSYFADIEAWIKQLQPPAYPFPVNQATALRGREVYNRACSECHGTYGNNSHYPNLLVPQALIGTDSTLQLGAGQFADVYLDWFRRSFYGETARLEPERGYVPPPLDGVWATAPFLHNGSVPTIAALLDTSKRPKYWTRTFDSTDYDPAALGWHYTELDHGQDGEPDAAKKKMIYDTTLFGYGNGGHDFGDNLTPDDRTAVIEYLKTL